MERSYRGNILLVFGDFDPPSNYVLALVEEAKALVPFESIFFLCHGFKNGTTFLKDERMMLLSSMLPNPPTPIYAIDGESFVDGRRETISEKITRVKKLNPKAHLYMVMDSNHCSMVMDGPDWAAITALVQPILYLLPEHRDLPNNYALASQTLLFINPTPKLNALSKASIFEVNREFFSPMLIEVMNKSESCAIERIKKHLSETRFKHCLRVSGTSKRICELVKEEDDEFQYNLYLASIYHDICKELPKESQESIAKETLKMESYSSWRDLHGPIASWYLREKYSFDNPEILEAIAQHTTPSENPLRITIFLYLADKLEPGKKNRYPEEFYEEIWTMIGNQRPVEAFHELLNWLKDKY